MKAPAPALATLVDRAPDGDEWLHEMKLDGYRILARLEGGRAMLSTRRGEDWTHRFPEIVRAVEAVAVDRALLDGEVVQPDARGIPDFQALQNALGQGRSSTLLYFVFDLLESGERSLADEPLEKRKAELVKLLGRKPPEPIRYLEHVVGKGPRFFDEACRAGLEGIVSKRRDRPYRGGRGRDWLKIKCVRRQELVIGGYTEPRGSRGELGALLLGVHDDRGRLVFAGRVGTGFTGQSLVDVKRKLAPLEREAPPFADPPRGVAARGVHWVEPSYLAEVEFAGWTNEGKLRAPSFKGLRQDKSPREIVREEPQAVTSQRKRGAPRQGEGEVAGVRLTHPERVLYPEEGTTKRDLARYYESVAEHILPHLAGRPLALLRCPDGHAGECFFQKNVERGFPSVVGKIEVKEGRGTNAYAEVEDVAGLIGLVQMNVLEIHPWGSRRGSLENPDRMFFDLDPGPGVEWKSMLDAARELRGLLEALGLKSFLKTTGGKGLHVVCPLDAENDWDEVKGFSQALARAMERTQPKRYVASAAKAKRGGRIYVDYLRNARGATAVAPYSTRARPRAPVSAPIAWNELGPRLRPDAYTVESLPRRLAQLRQDPWRDFARTRQKITRAMKRAVGVG